MHITNDTCVDEVQSVHARTVRFVSLHAPRLAILVGCLGVRSAQQLDYGCMPILFGKAQGCGSCHCLGIPTGSSREQYAGGSAQELDNGSVPILYGKV